MTRTKGFIQLKNEGCTGNKLFNSDIYVEEIPADVVRCEAKIGGNVELYSCGILKIVDESLKPLIGKRVQVIVIPEEEI